MTSIIEQEQQVVPTIGRIVHYTLTQQDVDMINRRRNEILGPIGNTVRAGGTYPMMVTRVWGNEPTSAVNGQVFLDGNDSHWVTSVNVGVGERHFAWPARA